MMESSTFTSVNGAPLPGFTAQSTSPEHFTETTETERSPTSPRRPELERKASTGWELQWCDYDNDGNEDLDITGYGGASCTTTRGMVPSATVTEKARVGDIGLWGSSAAFFDYDNDGFLDLVVANYVNFDLNHNVPCSVEGVRSYCHPFPIPWLFQRALPQTTATVRSQT